MRRLHTLRQAGDTIVEVLVATAIISLVLAVSYAIVNRSVAFDQDTQEYSQAQQILARQVEGLRAIAQSGSQPLINLATNGCIGQDGSGNPTFVAPGSGCGFKADNTVCAADDQPCFNVTITTVNSVYTITANWANSRGQTNSIYLEYGV